MGGGNEQDLRIPDGTRTMVQQRSQESSSQTIYGWPGLAKMGRAAWCTGELKIDHLKSTASQSAFREGTGVPNSKRGFSDSAKQSGADKNTIVQYLGIAADEPDRIKRHTKPGIMLPLVEIGWDEAYCRQWCEENDLLSPIYTTSTRGGCWFCHNQGIDQLRLLRKTYPEYWALMLKWDKDSPVTFHPDGKTVHDFERRFAAEDRGLVPSDRKFRWKMLEDNDKQTGV